MKLRKMLKVSVTVEVDRDGDSFYAHCPGLKGLHVDGATEKKQFRMHLRLLRYISTPSSDTTILYPLGLISPPREHFLRPKSGKRILSRNVEVQWPTAEVCGVS